MSAKPEPTDARPCWFVGAAWGGTNDQTSRFLQNGNWAGGNQNKYLDAVKSIQPGDRIAIKAAYTRKNKLPFDNRDHTVSTMAIKAIGTVTENPGDGRTLKVDWTPVDPPREWYFYTNRNTVWQVAPGTWAADALIDFTFENQPQDLDQFRNDPFWRERFGDIPADQRQFHWTLFYQALADQLLIFRDRRNELVAGIHQIAQKVTCMTILQDQHEEGVHSGPLTDICPFTTMGIFNRGLTDHNRKLIATELANFLGVTEPVPDTFDGVPLLNNQRSWFFGYHYRRQPDDIDALWELFARAIAFADSDTPDARPALVSAYHEASRCWGTGWNLSMGLFWIRPWNFPTLDDRSRQYIDKALDIRIGRNDPKGRCSGDEYLAVLETLKARFQEDTYPVHSFPELSHAAWLFKDSEPTLQESTTVLDARYNDEDAVIGEQSITDPLESYSLDHILADGCFIPRDRLESILQRLQAKKNLILQGPPGTGKTWLARRLAFALMEQRDHARLHAVQFHSNLSYEDFVRGYRPGADGRLDLVDGPFIEMIEAARQTPTETHVILIEEINRGNPAQVFGEMLTLLEADKRNRQEALALTHRRSPDERVFIPDNLHVIGTMNIADRSIALVDLALRRRFAFIDLEPTLGAAWRDWVQHHHGIEPGILADIEQRLNKLNHEIAADSSLGAQFRVGHSYVTPPLTPRIDDAWHWFRQVVETEIGPLLDEYWFDDAEKSRQARQRLLDGIR